MLPYSQNTCIISLISLRQVADFERLKATPMLHHQGHKKNYDCKYSSGCFKDTRKGTQHANQFSWIMLLSKYQCGLPQWFSTRFLIAMLKKHKVSVDKGTFFGVFSITFWKLFPTS